MQASPPGDRLPEHLVGTSKFLSRVLRHQPESIGLVLDREGWADIDELIAAAHCPGLSREAIERVVADNNKARFAIDPTGRRIRAVQGHSTDAVSLTYPALEPPDLLYHGTARRFLDSIRVEGLRPGRRHHVHLSADPATARAVGSRHGSPVVLEVRSGRMFHDGTIFHRSDNGVWLAARVPVDHIDFP